MKISIDQIYEVGRYPILNNERKREREREKESTHKNSVDGADIQFCFLGVPFPRFLISLNLCLICKSELFKRPSKPYPL